MGTIHPVLVVPAGDPQNHLHDQCHRVDELPVTQGRKTRGHFPIDDAVLKICYLAIRNIGHNRGGELGTRTNGWRQALNPFAITYPGRVNLTRN